MKRSKKVAAGTALVTALAVGGGGNAAAQAAPWQAIATGGMNISDQVGLARTSDDVLHLVYQQNNTSLIARTISPAGTVGAPVPAVSGWSSVDDPALVVSAGTLSAFFPGTPTLDTGNAQAGLDMATSADGGASWTVNPTAVAVSNGVGSVPAAAVSGATVLQAWQGSAPDGLTLVHSGLDPAAQPGAGYSAGGNQGLAAAADGTAMVASCGGSGVSAAPVTVATGGAAGPAVKMAGTGFCDATARTQIVARPGGGFSIAAPSASRTKVLVWKVGGGAPATIAGGGSTKQQIALSTTPEGRLWAAWEDSETGKLVFTRSNKTATTWGAAVTLALPKGQGTYQVDLNAQTAVADVIARTSEVSNTVRLIANQVLPGLSLVVTGGRTQSFRVLDAGDPVAGATVKVAGQSLTTNAQGRVGTDLKPGRYTVAAGKSGYVGAKGRVRAS